ncbi:MAG TPA: DUF222 domain-containing protein [Dermatophilaceae bacterium]|nr:DUF222 domain-containing protein [Dermatophilaceae bacterium]
MLSDAVTDLVDQARRLFAQFRSGACEMDEADLLDVIGLSQRLANVAGAVQAVAVAAFAASDTAPDGVGEYADCEVGTALGYATAAASALTHRSVKIVTDLPTTLAAMAAGDLDTWRAHTIAAELRDVDHDGCGRVEALAFPAVTGDTARAARGRVRRALAQVDPDLVRRRQEAAVRDRDVVVAPGVDGVSDWWMRLRTDQSVKCAAAVNARAAQLRRRDPDLTLGQARADAVADLILGHAEVVAHLRLTIPVQTFTTTPPFGDPADAAQPESPLGWEVAGVGVISHALVADIMDTFPTRISGILIDAQTGAAVATTARAYTPPASVGALVRARDGTCRFPHCTVPATRCDLDHVQPWPAGPTSPANLAALCRHHHRAKTHGGWEYTLHPDGTCTWVTPHGGQTMLTRPTDHREMAA